jgi:hypothetical protein
MRPERRCARRDTMTISEIAYAAVLLIMLLATLAPLFIEMWGDE